MLNSTFNILEHLLHFLVNLCNQMFEKSKSKTDKPWIRSIYYNLCDTECQVLAITKSKFIKVRILRTFFLLIIDSLTHVKQKKPINTIQLFRMYSNSKAFESSLQYRLSVLKYNKSSQ